MITLVQYLIRRTVQVFSVATAIAMLASVTLAEHEGKVQILLLGDSTTEGSIPRLIKPEGPHLEMVIEQLLAAEKDLPPCHVINSGLSGEYIRRLIDSGRYPLEKVPEKYHALVKPFVNGPSVVVMANELDGILGHLPGWYGDRHPNLAGYNVIADETAKYLATIMRTAGPKLPKSLDADSLGKLSSALTLHASFDKGLDADFSRGDRICYVKKGAELNRAEANADAKLLPEAGRFGGALHFTKKSSFQPAFKDAGVLGYNDKNWNTTVSVWLRLNPDLDLEPGYCDPVQIVGDDGKKGFIFLEFSKDETPRYFSYAIRPLFHIWNPDNVTWADIPFDKRPMVQVERPPFSREAWTHVVFTLENVNNKSGPQVGRLYLNGELQGSIENWDLTFGWDPSQVLLVLGASYVGHMDDLAVFNRVLSHEEVKQLYSLKNGVRDLLMPEAK